jgi:transcriptional regulator GlxA family with amidase domain
VPSTAAEDASVAAAIDEIVTHGGRLRVDDVARSVGISVRHLERRFRDRVGLTPKRLAGILRLQRALACLGSNEPPPLVDVAYRCGYFDQPHFIRDFGRFTGMSPSQFLRGERGMDRFFFSP